MSIVIWAMNHSMCNTVRVLGGLAIVLSNETQRLSELLYWKSKVSFWESKIPNFKKWKTELRNSVSSWSMEEESESSRLSQSECVWWLTKCFFKTFQIENLDQILEILESILAWQRGSEMGHVIYIILLAIWIEYFGRIMRTPSGHVIRKSGF